MAESEFTIKSNIERGFGCNYCYSNKPQVLAELCVVSVSVFRRETKTGVGCMVIGHEWWWGYAPDRVFAF